MLVMQKDRFNAFYSPEEVPSQLCVARRGNIMCCAVVGTPWAGGVWNYDGYIRWISNSEGGNA